MNKGNKKQDKDSQVLTDTEIVEQDKLTQADSKTNKDSDPKTETETIKEDKIVENKTNESNKKQSLPSLALAGAILNIISTSFWVVMFILFIISSIISFSSDYVAIEIIMFVFISIMFVPSILAFKYNIKLIVDGSGATKSLYIKAGVFALLSFSILGGICVLVSKE